MWTPSLVKKIVIDGVLHTVVEWDDTVSPPFKKTYKGLTVDSIKAQVRRDKADFNSADTDTSGLVEGVEVDTTVPTPAPTPTPTPTAEQLFNQTRRKLEEAIRVESLGLAKTQTAAFATYIQGLRDDLDSVSNANFKAWTGVG